MLTRAPRTKLINVEQTKQGPASSGFTVILGAHRIIPSKQLTKGQEEEEEGEGEEEGEEEEEGGGGGGEEEEEEEEERGRRRRKNKREKQGNNEKIGRKSVAVKWVVKLSDTDAAR